MNEIFDYLKNIFNENGFRLYMIGGTSRDYLLGNNIDDYDFVTDATPDEIGKFLKVDSVFKKYGTVKFYYKDKIKVDIVTLREEKNYKDFRHPSEIKFVKDIKLDYKRRDFTINAIYIDEKYNVIDPANGFSDLKDKKLKFIGNSEERIIEDPLRILRGIRFKKEYNLNIDDDIEKLFKKYSYLLDNLNKDKIKEEELKMERIVKNECKKL